MTDRSPFRATYRVQLHGEFDFDAAAGIAAYLADLGVSHFYASPYLQAAPGSTHGYDVVNHSKVNEELGGAAGHARMCQALREHGLGQVLDVVPNHMAIPGRQNEWWWDVLENGPSSIYASYFDVDWDPPESKLRNRVLLPILGDHYGRVLEDGEIKLLREGGSFVVRYYDNDAPVAPKSLDWLLASAAGRLPHGELYTDELESIATSFSRLPPSVATDRASVRERHRDKEVLRRRLSQLCEQHPEVAAAIDAEVDAINATPDGLDLLLERQNYRLAYWRTAGRELDYRRFFDITSLIGLRIEDEHVFEDTHRLVLQFFRDGVLDGLRIDHPDGLRNPGQYLQRLHDATGGAWVVVEKILEPGERLPSWPVAGTTGYDFLNRLGGIFVDPSGEEALTKAYAEFTDEPVDYEAVVLEKKQRAIRQILAADLNRLAELFVQVVQRHRRFRDYTRHELREVLAEVLSSYGVYRTYACADTGELTEADRHEIRSAVAKATERRPDLDPDLFGFLRSILLLETTGDLEGELAMRVQQVTGPVMAKGVEDTAFYTYNRLTALNEVGGDPGQFGLSVPAFHEACAEASEHWSLSMLALSTHDTKRSEDVRVRIALLSEMPNEWAAAAARWRDRNQRHKRAGLPDANAEWLLYQTLVGAWPLSAERAMAYMEKASKEAKTHTSWIDPNPEYDDALRGFVEGILNDDEFVADLSAFVEPLVLPGRVNSLAQKLVQLTAPGVPDIYQGTELWDLSLVDPDNRRPVNYDERRALLAELRYGGLTVDDVLARSDEGLPKLLVVHRTLEVRARIGVLGPYRPLDAPDRGLAFARGDDLVTVVPRLVLRGPVEGSVGLPEGRWRNVFTGEELSGGPTPMTDLLARFPVALLVRP